MLSRLRQRFRDMRTIKTLCQGAERHANADGQSEAGVEHFILAALELPDGTARQAFARVGADPERFRDAIAQQYRDALRGIGLASPQLDALCQAGAAVPPKPGLYQGKPSVQSLMRQLADWPRASAAEPLLGAHVIAVGAAQQGVAPRALRAMGIDLAALAGAARAEIAAVAAA
ncbi:peptidase [Janthinobacterium sp. BJB412]|nr:peptidase [Janthinobacterium sp. BJB412]